MILILLFIPRVKGILLKILRDGRMIVIRQIKRSRAILADSHIASIPLDLHVAFENRQGGCDIREVNTKMRGMREREFFMSKGQRELTVLGTSEVQVDNSFLQMNGRSFASGITQRELWKFDYRVGRDTQRTAVFELHFCAAISLGLQLDALSNW